MASVNKKFPKVKAAPALTHGGAPTTTVPAEQELRRTLMTCLLWENSFYESGEGAAKRLADLVPQVKPARVAEFALQAKYDMKLRHAPLYLIRELARYTSGNVDKQPSYRWKKEPVGEYVRETLTKLIRRPDELSEFLAMYWKDGKQPISAAVKRGLSEAFSKFDEFQLAKWNKDKDIKLRDVMFLTHPKPIGRDQKGIFSRLANNELATPDTWEVALSAGKDKKATFERLLKEDRLGGIALLKNLRGMLAAGVDEDLIRIRLERGVGMALPFHFIAAAKYAPRLSDSIEKAMLLAVAEYEPLAGKTLLVIDTSGSMHGQLSAKSEQTRLDAAKALVILARGLCEKPTIYLTAGNDMTRTHATQELPRHLTGFSISEAIDRARYDIGGGGIFLKQCMDYIQTKEPKQFDRVVVFTDEQDCDTKCDPAKAAKLGDQNYVVNIAAYKNGTGYKNGWNHIDGWSERIFDYIRVFESNLTD